jgi:hypothetical protein
MTKSPPPQQCHYTMEERDGTKTKSNEMMNQWKINTQQSIFYLCYSINCHHICIDDLFGLSVSYLQTLFPFTSSVFFKNLYFLHVCTLTTMQGTYTCVSPLKVVYTKIFLKKI